MKLLDSGLSAVRGYKTAGIHAGIKKAKRDLALIVSGKPAAAAGVFTTNMVQAAPVTYDKALLAAGNLIQAIVVNSGNANACTGKQGALDAEAMAKTTAQALDVRAINAQSTAVNPGTTADTKDGNQVLVCSTGVIGVPLPMKTVNDGIKEAAAKLSNTRKSAIDTAEAILTTDTFKKETAVEITIEGKPVVLAGIAKGSGMIHPNMATLLSFIITDANIEAETLQGLLGNSISSTYNMISVDGDTSTNDTVLTLANGASGTPAIVKGTEEYEKFAEAFDYVHAYLAKQVVRDGEGASKFIEVQIKGAATEKDAKLLAKAIITSNLVKTALFGEDANWGRILCAMGYSGAQFNPDTVDLTLASSKGSLLLLKQGAPVPFDENIALTILQEHDIDIKAVLQEGSAEAAAWGCDLSYEYVKINGEYRT
ncbi:MAG: bifunctional glutamate N-acetyltransferase/amino-acid acetyltransferase ArgJ [Spirochaetales bacterium]|nr:bifunctional glutamate N-acetyltransferase/amino-acid acetyltransferase ArgJ [Spirochaetales bacterium]